MNIYFVNKKSKLKGPFDITDAHRNKIMCVGDVCIRDTSDGLTFLLICNDINKWNACKCIDKTQSRIGVEANSLLFSFDGVNKRFGRKNVLSVLYECFDNQPIHDFFKNALDIISYKSDFWDVSLFLMIHQLSAITIEPNTLSTSTGTTNHTTRFESYFSSDMSLLFKELNAQGYSLRDVYQCIRERFPNKFRQALKNFLKENPHSTIYDK